VTQVLIEKLRIGATQSHVGIFGGTLFQSVVALDLIELAQKVASEFNATIQLVDAKNIVSPNHLLFATIHALTAFDRGTGRASTLGMEILRFAAAQRQISQALNLLGLSESTKHIGGVIVGENTSQIQNTFHTFLDQTKIATDQTVLELTSKKKERAIQDTFQISNEELEAITVSTNAKERKQALQKLVYDRCALLAISR
jgi:tRNA threonylcarbamoyladenosine modification (KEOPS) complex Cgi121 subunit